MDHGRLGCLYAGATATSTVTLVTCAIVWGYWQNTLDTCVDMNCGCLFYSQWTWNQIVGGRVSACQFITYAPIPVLTWSFFMAVYHLCSHCCFTKHSLWTSPDGSAQRRIDPSIRSLRTCYSFPTVMSILITILVLISSIILVDGHLRACSEGRKPVLKQMEAIGDMAGLILDRMTCYTIYSFMDYLQPDPWNLDIRYRRTYKINTGAAIYTAIAASWMTVVIYIVIVSLPLRAYYQNWRLRKGRT